MSMDVVSQRIAAAAATAEWDRVLRLAGGLGNALLPKIRLFA
jgi:hypothetical protein